MRDRHELQAAALEDVRARAQATVDSQRPLLERHPHPARRMAAAGYTMADWADYLVRRATNYKALARVRATALEIE